MKLSELPQDIQDKLIEERANLHEKWKRNTPWEVCFVNKEGTRFFSAYRKNDFAGYGSAYGWWEIRYGAIRWQHKRENFWGFFDEKYEWVQSELYGRSQNGTEIPEHIHTKKEVLALVKAIGIFDI